MYKMITIDVDDTLLTDENIVTEATQATLQEAIKLGVHVTLATGRMYASAKQIASQLNLNVPLITYQGSLVKNLLDEKVLYERTVPVDAVKWLLEAAIKKDCHIQVFSNDTLYVLHENEKVKEYSRISKVPYLVVADHTKLIEMPITKILFNEQPTELDVLAKEIRKHIGNLVHVTKSKPFFLEILHKEGTKGHAVQFLANHYGCNMSEVISIGDSWNDREMIEMAGLGVAMGNAVDELKEIADYVTLTNNEDGVKRVVDRFILQNEHNL